MSAPLSQRTWGARLYFVGLAFFVLASIAAIYSSNHSSHYREYRWDFIQPYSSAKCMLAGCDPYDIALIAKQYATAGGDPAALDARHSWHVLLPVYPPSAFLVVAPFTALNFARAQVLWFYLSAVLFCLSAGLLGMLLPRAWGWLYFLLASMMLSSASTNLLLGPGNPGVLAIAFACLAVWAFHGVKLPWAGAVLLALSLAIKPQIAIAVVLLLLLRKATRGPAALSAALALGLLFGSAVWLQHTTGGAWAAGLRHNLAECMGPQGANWPVGPEAFRLLNLQAAVALWLPDPTEYNFIVYGIAVLVAGWWLTAYVWAGSAEPLTALAGLLCLSLVPIYHRDYDSRLLVLTLLPLTRLLMLRWRLGMMLLLVSVPLLFSQTTLHMLHWLQVTNHPGLGPWSTLFLLRQQSVAMLMLAVLWPLAMYVPVEPVGDGLGQGGSG